MTLRTYQDFLVEFPTPHLVLARLGDVSVLTSERIVGKLLDVLMLHGDYAMANVWSGPSLVLQCVFQYSANAERFATVVRATPFEGYSGLASQRVFELNSVTRNAMSSAQSQLWPRRQSV